MADAAPATPVVPAPAETPKGKGKKAAASKAVAKKPKAVPSHPPTAQMVTKAITDLKEKGGSSLSAIKKFIGSTYKVDAQKLAPFIRKYLVSAVAAGKLVQTKGKGASGSFKLATKEKAPKEKKVVKKEKTAAAPKKKAATATKAKKPAAAAAAKKPKAATAAKKPAAAKKPKTPTKAKATKPSKKAAKSPAKKAPKPKKIAVAKKAAPKKK
uniref:Histone H1.2 n=2 Tax=Cacopsylla melanoneura TaxID=428564 RepID=A0A8D8MF57_9HEMI